MQENHKIVFNFIKQILILLSSNSILSPSSLILHTYSFTHLKHLEGNQFKDFFSIQ